MEKFINIAKNLLFRFYLICRKETCTINSGQNAIIVSVVSHIANALKFTIRGTITLAYNIFTFELYLYLVRDTGKGIAGIPNL